MRLTIRPNLRLYMRGLLANDFATDMGGRERYSKHAKRSERVLNDLRTGPCAASPSDDHRIQ